MVAPMMSGKNSFLRDMKTKYGAVTIGFSGWAKSPKFNFGRRTDYSFPMSDHCDFDELVKMVVESGAEQVYTIHGFVEEFAEHLRTLGISAQPLRENSLDDFV
jgi:putative mRNA 3-end processing factor